MVVPVAATAGKVKEPVVTVTVGEFVMLAEVVGTEPDTVSVAAAFACGAKQNRPNINARNPRAGAPPSLSVLGATFIGRAALVATFGPKTGQTGQRGKSG